MPPDPPSPGIRPETPADVLVAAPTVIVVSRANAGSLNLQVGYRFFL